MKSSLAKALPALPAKVLRAPLLSTWIVCVACAVPMHAAWPAAPAPRDLEQRAGLDQRLGAAIPPDLNFRTSRDESVHLSDLLHGKPGVLALGYYRCPNMCSVVLRGIGQAAAAMPLEPGVDYSITFVSIDSRETPADAADTEQMLMQMYPTAHVARWNLLTGDERSVRALAQAIGYRYYYDPALRQFVHPAAIAVTTPAGRINQYRIGADYSQESLRLGLIDASQGRLGSLIDRLVLLCCGYDPSTGKYDLLIGRIMQVLGIGFALALAFAILRLRRRIRT